LPGRWQGTKAQVLLDVGTGLPVALMLIGTLGHITGDDQARTIVTRLLDALSSGS
jgi:hypothetical protein